MSITKIRKYSTVLLNIATYTILVYLALYFYLFPKSIINQHLLFLSIVFIYFFMILTLSLREKSNHFLILLNLTIFIFIKSAAQPIHGLELFLDDPYYYYSMTLNILFTNTLNPILASWHWLINLLPFYPVLHLWTGITELLLGFSPSVRGMKNATIFVAYLSSLIPIITYLITVNVTNEKKTGIIASIIVTASSGLVFYQYQQQYLPILFFLMIVLLLFKQVTIKKSSYIVLFTLLSLSFSLTHRASNIIIFTFITLFLFLLIISYTMDKQRFKNHKQGLKIFQKYKYFLSGFFVLLIFVSSNLYIYNTIFIEYLISIGETYFTNPFTDIYFEQRASIPFSTFSLHFFEQIYSYFSYAKYYLLFLSLIGFSFVFLSRYNKHDLETRNPILELYLVFLVLTFVAGLAVYEAINRYYIFLTPFIAILCSISIVKLYNCSNKKLFVKVFLMLFVLAVSADFIYALPTKLLFNGDYYINPPIDQFRSSGTWLFEYDNSQRYEVMSGYEHVIDFYAQKPRSSLISVPTRSIANCDMKRKNFPLLLGNIEYINMGNIRSFNTFNRHNFSCFSNFHDKIYGNGLLKYYV